jgi:hypothetical protein
MKLILQLAAAWNILFGIYAVMFPDHYFQWVGMPVPNYPQLWQCIGMIVGVFGIGYWIASYDPVKHWPIVLVGLLGKIFGPIGFLLSIGQGLFPWKFGQILFVNDIIWWIPFGYILVQAIYRSRITVL